MHHSTDLEYRKTKWQVVGHHFIYKLRFDYRLKEDYYHPDGWYGVFRGMDRCWYVIAYIGCAWDGATKYPDFLWMMVPSLVHDILHWLIKRGIIGERFNDLIDMELEYAVVHGKQPIPLRQGGNSKFTRTVRARIIRIGANTADEVFDTTTEDVRHRKVRA